MLGSAVHAVSRKLADIDDVDRGRWFLSTSHQKFSTGVSSLLFTATPSILQVAMKDCPLLVSAIMSMFFSFWDIVLVNTVFLKCLATSNTSNSPVRKHTIVSRVLSSCARSFLYIYTLLAVISFTSLVIAYISQTVTTTDAIAHQVAATNVSTKIVTSATSSAPVAVLSAIVGPQIAIPIDISYHHPHAESSEPDVNSSNVLYIPIAVLIPALLFHLGYHSGKT
ncbi:hypothetical protein FISHEDRAFT_69165 [Fistulina hepatica ATCC 64428]|uniref:Uncharacterized protein n=1 Tax=Fistulina hepatica ATCC 64428 TaxID=1128425 RepID=A0A0D7AR85_9AGAR|nr:hypothetical protein FISHEDRAFT_69165 [Fistulina hepatica ATCC 64428]